MKLKKGFFKKGIVFFMAAILLVGNCLSASATSIKVETEDEIGDYPSPNVIKSVENLTRSDGKTYIGDVLKYTIRVTNDEENSTWKNVYLYDTLPEGIDFNESKGVTLNGSNVPNAYNSGNREISVHLGDIAGYDSSTSTIADVHVIIFYSTVNDLAVNTAIFNSVSVEGDNGTGESTDGGVQVTYNDPIAQAVKIAKNLSNPGGKTVVGDKLEYKITLTNGQINSVWNNVIVKDTLPVGVDFDTNSKVYINGVETVYDYDNATRLLTVVVGDIKGGKEDGSQKDIKVVTFEVTVNEKAYNAVVYNTVVAEGDNGSTSTTDPGTEVGSKTPITSGTKTVENLTHGDQKTIVGDVLEYTITITNEQINSVWKNAVVKDPLPEGLDFDSSSNVYINGTAVSYTYDNATRLLTIPVGDLEGGNADGSGKDVKVIKFQVTVNEDAYGKTITNRANIGDKCVTGPDTEVVSGTPIQNGDKTVANITNQGGKTIVGDILEYTITLTNDQTNSVWKNAVVRDTLPEGLDFIANTKVYINGVETAYTYNPATRVLMIPVGDINGGKMNGTGKDIKTITFQVVVNESAYGKTITNVANIGDKEVTSPGVDVVSGEPRLDASKSSKNMTRNSQKGQVGDIIRYTIKVANSQLNSVWQDIYVYDTIPVEVDFLPNTKVYVNGNEVSYTYDVVTKLLTVALGDVNGGKSDGTGKTSYEVVFDTTVNILGYNKIVVNVAYIEPNRFGRSVNAFGRSSALQIKDAGQNIGN